jgi:hypothetical protein
MIVRVTNHCGISIFERNPVSGLTERAGKDETLPGRVAQPGRRELHHQWINWRHQIFH